MINIIIVIIIIALLFVLNRAMFFSDVRDTVNYKEVMKQYNLGPNGGIVTSLNLFTTKFHQVIELINKANKEHNYVIFDTPGQIEVFTWSASGSIITEALASEFPTIIVYVIDTVRSVNPVTFMSNMLYACSILYKTKLPFIVVMNKVIRSFPHYLMQVCFNGLDITSIMHY